MAKSLDIADFMDMRQQGWPVLDVRSPGEHTHGRIPQACNLPLFDNQERAAIGTIYKQQGRQQAIEEGLKIVGPKLYSFVQQAQEAAQDRKLLLHCWRGGMRSQSMATLLRTAGFEVGTLKGGYKAYRTYVQSQLERPYPFVVIGGKTGSGKTDILKALQQQGEQVIDLEGLANHKGSAFGGLGQAPQPSGEMFENLLWEALSCMNFEQRIWIEDESEFIGKLFVPKALFRSMQAAPTMVIELPISERVSRLTREYGHMDETELKESLLRIQRRLGGKRTQDALAAFQDKNYASATEIALAYYDKAYLRALNERPSAHCHPMHFDQDQPDHIAQALISYVNQNVSPA